MLVVVLAAGRASSARASSHLQVAYQWRYLDWVWPNIPLSGKNYTLGNAFTQDVDIDRQGRVFVTSPQWLDGVPASLSLVTKVHGPGGRLLVPYPNWTWHTPLNCDSIVSVYRLAVIVSRLIRPGSRIYLRGIYATRTSARARASVPIPRIPERIDTSVCFPSTR